ncbi:hypothetical protein [Legionella maioricensis]|uniref:Uncharacterized protein n=1 Tax=Legionella maioricensis TaxID=2896528 RepID=A0A9X2D1N7_9GAMM|nr:hypothetical protein [Legionella maioricensis]MCL9684864.1 hypothetical protein [Legionella maioricensis]MCL9688940.1 hypothetical protein [Legionella maioricensis]
MSITKSSTLFFEKMEHTYKNAVFSVKQLIEQGELTQTSYLEVNFVLKLIAKLQLGFGKNSIVTAEILEEMLQGAYLKFEDNGSLYNELIAIFHLNLRKRSSSHASCVQQYSFSGPVVKEILFGVSENKTGTNTTWVQFEKHNTNTPINLILHLFDYVMHQWTGKNIGPYGSSNYTESNPLIVNTV